jgi:hypothetical protein
MEGVIAFAEYYLLSAHKYIECIVTALTQRTLVAWKLALGASTIVWIPADTADIVVGHIPAPGGDSIPFSYGDLHDAVCCCCGARSYVCRLCYGQKMDGGTQTRVVLAWQMHGR